jgi:hypothetical protein
VEALGGVRSAGNTDERKELGSEMLFEICRIALARSRKPMLRVEVLHARSHDLHQPCTIVPCNNVHSSISYLVSFVSD